jgi:ribosomal-protein-alanine N-acetyltransferase
MSFSDVKTLILEEQGRQLGSFIDVSDIEDYFLKLKNNAEFSMHYSGDELAGFVAFYCNDESKDMSFITLVLLDLEYRKIGLASSLIKYTLEFCKLKGFNRCGLEVKKENYLAIRLYEKIGFEVQEDLGSKFFMCVSLVG